MTHSHTVAEPKPLRLGEQLVALGLVTQDQLRIALHEQKNTSKPLGDTLLGLGFIPQETIRCALAERLGEQSISLKGVVADARALLQQLEAHND